MDTNMKKSKLFPTLYAATGALLLAVCFTFAACGSDDDSSSSDPANPDAVVPDPEGTISVLMRNGNNGNTIIDNFIRINDANNFERSSDYTKYPTQIVDLGKMNGLGNVTKIPMLGWATEVAVQKGHGYVIYDGKNSTHQYYRFWVEKSTLNISNEIIGWQVRYQKPFKGVDEALKPAQTTVDFGMEASKKDNWTQELQMKNSTIIPFEATSSASWLRTELSFNGVKISVDKPETAKPKESATLTLTTLYGRATQITVTRENPLWVEFHNGNTLEVEGSADMYYAAYFNFNEQYSADNYMTVSTTATWIKDLRFNSWNSVYVEFNTAEANTTGKSRTANIELRAKGTNQLVATLTVIQKPQQ